MTVGSGARLTRPQIGGGKSNTESIIVILRSAIIAIAAVFGHRSVSPSLFVCGTVMRQDFRPK